MNMVLSACHHDHDQARAPSRHFAASAASPDAYMIRFKYTGTETCIAALKNVPIVHPMFRICANWGGTILCFIDGVNSLDFTFLAFIDSTNIISERSNFVGAHLSCGNSQYCIFSLLSSHSTAYGLAQNLWIHLGACSPTSDQWNMSVIPGALQFELLSDASTAREETCGLLD